MRWGVFGSLLLTSVLTTQDGFERAIRDQIGLGLGFPFSFEGDAPSNLHATVIRTNGPDDDDEDAIAINLRF